MSVTAITTLPDNQTHYLTEQQQQQRQQQQEQQQQQQQEQPLVNPEAVEIYQLISYGIIGEAVVVFGIVTNIMNIICFVKQGFKESINVSLLSLAISDLGCLLTMMWPTACMVPQVREADLPFDPWETMYLTSSIPHVIFTRITGVITAFITLERCLCVTMPLKVASIFTPRRVAVINSGIFVTLIISASPVYASGVIAMKYVPERNKTIVGVIFTEDRAIKEHVSFIINSVLVPFIALSVIIVCMVTMVITLQKQAKWRRQQSSVKEIVSSADRERRLVKMIVMISTLFVVCFCPSAILFLGIAVEPGFNFGGKYVDITIIAYGISNIAESTNSAVNIFIYYSMSSRYRTCFRQSVCAMNIK